jgi:hypothetical protein
MRLYGAYLLAAILSFYLLMLYYGVSAGLANYSPIAALIGAILLSVGAAPTLLFHQRFGLWLGLVGCLLLLPYSLVFLSQIVAAFAKGETARWFYLFAGLPAMFVLLSTYWTVRSLWQQVDPTTSIPTRWWLKGLLAGLPLLAWTSYLISIWPYMSWGMFRF